MGNNISSAGVEAAVMATAPADLQSLMSKIPSEARDNLMKALEPGAAAATPPPAAPAAPPAQPAADAAPAAPAGLDRKALVHKVFEAMDKDKSGAVDIGEFLKAAVTEGEEVVKKLEGIFTFMDKNSDKSLTEEEYQAGMGTLSHVSDAMFEEQLQQVLKVLAKQKQ